MVLKRVGVLSCALISAVVGCLLGLVLGAMALVILLLGLAAGITSGSDLDVSEQLLILGGLVFLMPVVYGIAGFIFGLVGGALFNLGARWTGGLKVDIS